jgi:hypothetical protein
MQMYNIILKLRRRQNILPSPFPIFLVCKTQLFKKSKPFAMAQWCLQNASISLFSYSAERRSMRTPELVD